MFVEVFCSSQTYSILDSIKELVVLTVDTTAIISKDMARWRNSLTSIGIDYILIGKGAQWHGWKWRIEEVYKELNKIYKYNDYCYAIICDCYDLIFQRKPIKSEIDILSDKVILGAEKQSTGIPEFNLKYTMDWENINGGFCMGKIENLLVYYQAIMERWENCQSRYSSRVTDQHVISDLYLRNNLPFQLFLDIESRFILNMTKDVYPNEYYISSEYIYSIRGVKKILPICIHDPGDKDKPIPGLIKKFDEIVKMNTLKN